MTGNDLTTSFSEYIALTILSGNVSHTGWMMFMVNELDRYL